MTVMAACEAPDARSPASVAGAPAYVAPKHAPGPMEGVRATRMAEVLAATGLDVRNLPPIEQLTPGQRQKVIRPYCLENFINKAIYCLESLIGQHGFYAVLAVLHKLHR